MRYRPASKCAARTGTGISVLLLIASAAGAGCSLDNVDFGFTKHENIHVILIHGGRYLLESTMQPHERLGTRERWVAASRPISHLNLKLDDEYFRGKHLFIGILIEKVPASQADAVEAILTARGHDFFLSEWPQDVPPLWTDAQSTSRPTTASTRQRQAGG